MLFGLHIDPIEICLHFIIVVVLVVPAVRDAERSHYNPKRALSWMLAILGTSALVRVAPTAQINAYLKLLGRSPDDQNPT
jgi:hypothetical protein